MFEDEGEDERSELVVLDPMHVRLLVMLVKIKIFSPMS